MSCAYNGVFAFIDYEEPESAEIAIATYHNKLLFHSRYPLRV